MIRRPPRSTLFPTRRSSDLYAQTAGYNNESGSVYYAADSYGDDRWENFYIMLAQFRALEDKYNKETPEQQANDKLYKDLAEVFVLDNLTQMEIGRAPCRERV